MVKRETDNYKAQSFDLIQSRRAFKSRFSVSGKRHIIVTLQLLEVGLNVSVFYKWNPYSSR